MAAALERITLPAFGAAAAVGYGASRWYRKKEPSLASFVGDTLILAAAAYASTIGGLDPKLLAQGSLLGAVALIGVYLASLSAGIIWWRLFSPNHPLAHIPGPLICKLCKWPQLYLVGSGHSRKTITKWHKKHGPIMRIAPNEVSCASADAVIPVHGANSWVRGISYTAAIHTKMGIDLDNASMLSLSHHETHSPRRKMWDRAFAMGALKGYEPLVLNRLKELCEEIDKRADEYQCLKEWSSWFVFDVTSDLVYGGGTNFIKTRRDVEGAVAGVMAAMRLQGKTMSVPWLAPYMGLGSLPQKSGEFIAYCTRRARERMADGPRDGIVDFMSHLMDPKEGEKPLSYACLQGEATLVVSAGADTTKVALVILLAYLLREPQYFKKLQAAVDAAVDADHTVSVDGEDFPVHDQVKNIPYLEACLHEALRMQPPLSMEPMRQCPPNGANLCGVAIPGGTQVRVLNHIIQNDEANYKDPSRFYPERWLVPDRHDSSKEMFGASFEKGTFFPFLYGPFHCAGKQFAFQEMRMFMATLLWKYDMTPPPGFNFQAFMDAIDDNGTLLEIGKPLLVKLTRRSKKAR